VRSESGQRSKIVASICSCGTSSSSTSSQTPNFQINTHTPFHSMHFKIIIPFRNFYFKFEAPFANTKWSARQTDPLLTPSPHPPTHQSAAALNNTPSQRSKSTPKSSSSLFSVDQKTRPSDVITLQRKSWISHTMNMKSFGCFYI
jgi:hypothetical protein